MKMHSSLWDINFVELLLVNNLIHLLLPVIRYVPLFTSFLGKVLLPCIYQTTVMVVVCLFFSLYSSECFVLFCLFVLFIYLFIYVFISHKTLSTSHLLQFFEWIGI